MKRLLIAESAPFIADIIAGYFFDGWDVQLCHSPQEAEDALLWQTPEALIICDNAKVSDARTILSNSFPLVPPTIIVITPNATRKEQRCLSRWGVDCIFETPYHPKLVRLTLDFLHNSQDATARRVPQHLRVLGVNAGPSGHLYLLLATSMLKPDMTQQLHNEIYCKIAHDVNVDERSVEKAIRSSIQNAWKRRDPRMWAHYFPTDENGNVACPKNREFISRLAELV